MTQPFIPIIEHPAPVDGLGFSGVWVVSFSESDIFAYETRQHLVEHFHLESVFFLSMFSTDDGFSIWGFDTSNRSGVLVWYQSGCWNVHRYNHSIKSVCMNSESIFVFASPMVYRISRQSLFEDVFFIGIVANARTSAIVRDRVVWISDEGNIYSWHPTTTPRLECDLKAPIKKCFSNSIILIAFEKSQFFIADLSVELKNQTLKSDSVDEGHEIIDMYPYKNTWIGFSRNKTNGKFFFPRDFPNEQLKFVCSNQDLSQASFALARQNLIAFCTTYVVFANQYDSEQTILSSWRASHLALRTTAGSRVRRVAPI